VHIAQHTCTSVRPLILQDTEVNVAVATRHRSLNHNFE
jgi:hypothetical protein